jgi:hypothetical protein
VTVLRNAASRRVRQAYPSHPVFPHSLGSARIRLVELAGIKAGTVGRGFRRWDRPPSSSAPGCAAWSGRSKSPPDYPTATGPLLAALDG